MSDDGDPTPNPLRLDLKRQTQKLLARLPAESPYFAALKNVASRPARLEILSALLRVPQHTLKVAILFKPLLLDLCARWLYEDEDKLEKFETLCLLLEAYQELYPVLATFLHMPAFHDGPLPALISGPILDAPALPLQRVLLAYYRLLQANQMLPCLLGWSLTPLAQLIWASHLDSGVRFLAIRCYALQSGMMEAERVKIEKQVVGELAEVDCPIAFGVNEDGTPRIADGWVIPALELERMTYDRDVLLQANDFYLDPKESSEAIPAAELSPLVANVHGILMLRPSPNPSPPSPLIDTPTAVHALRQMGLHLSMQVPILLTSSPSSGKSLLISHMANILYPLSRNHVVTIHLADTSLDPRSLLGSYISSPTRPGTFEWKEGVLVRAMREGKWVVLKDIDRATMEVLGILKPLVESLGADKWVGGRARLDVPSRGSITAEDSFALFATRSIQPSRQETFPNPTFFGSHKFYEVVVESPSASDLRLIVNTKFPRIAGVAAQGLINLWDGVRALGNQASTRDIGLRELERFCTRVSGLIPVNPQSMDVDEEPTQPTSLSQIFTNPTVREDIFLEARDVFFGAGATTVSGRAHLDAITQVVAAHLGISDERRDWILHARTPDFDVVKDVNGQITAVRAGRTRLTARVARADILPLVTRPFAMHRPAVSLISRLATAISLSEPVLLTGETGTGKTSVVTHLASLLRHPLISLNLSNQTESSDILGGFKPVDARIPGSQLQERFLELFGGTFSRKKNAHFEESVRKAVQERKWKRASGLWLEAVRLAKGRITAKQADENAKELEGAASRKRRKVDGTGLNVSIESWEAFERDVQTFEVQHVQGKSKFAFAFVEGPLVKALRNGDWILLDEVNLATPETLESISGLLHGPTASITLIEQGSLEPIPRHPDFRLFACMNPATDVGKKDLPPNIRSRFTEIDVPPPDADKETLLTIVSQYIGACAVGDRGAIMDVAEFYTAVKRLSEARQIADGANHRPHFSMRTLARALTFASDMASTYSLRRSLWEGCLMAFTMVLDGPSATAVTALAQKHILAGVKNPRSLLTREPVPPADLSAYVKFGPFYLERGPLPEDAVEDYIMTPSVETKLIDLARIIAAKRFPVLIEGPTSSGKTSSIEYLAKRTGHRFVRINNHEHTDIQEYIGTYVSDPITGKLVFKEGLLVRALRYGDWIVLDELNLAPTDVLEALNRLLDDNRELVIPETQEVVRPHPHFMLFATQNPSGLYAGRKVLSRAFRNRFLEVHFEDVPQAELETILCQRCRIAPSYGQRIVSVFRELQKRRQSSRVFESKHGFATLRDLFRWAGRDAMSYEELAANGYMLLAERARRDDDKVVVKEVIESIMKVRIDEASLYDLQSPKFDAGEFLGCPIPSSSQVVWTAAMQRLFVLIARALRFNEPVLLVGETGCGKTSVCQLYAEVLNRTLRSVNCHQNTETADLIGGLRPIRNKATLEAETLREAVTTLSHLGVSNPTEDAASLIASIDSMDKSGSLSAEQALTLNDLRARLQRLSALFEWRDGPLVEAMRDGDVFLLDEISLADDSVLERLNSVLEPGRTIVLAERGGTDAEIPAIKAADEFKLVATMNPGGDYGKKELSPALRNRFTEIWVPSITDRKDLECIIATLWTHDSLRSFTQPLLDFVEWLCTAVNDRAFANLRDILAWVSFSNGMSVQTASYMSPDEVFHQAAQMTFLDGLGSMPQLSAYSKDALEGLKSDATAKLHQLVQIASTSSPRPLPSPSSSNVHFGHFPIPRGPSDSSPNSFSLEAPTTRDNVLRVVRACQLPKPIMLEGSPGVGKTSLVAALANMCGHHLCRINLSDQTDLVDLFGSDLPVEGGEPGQFAWKDAEFLRALQEGHWVLLDEMNLAPQSVLEGLNAVLDHRGTVYIPELGRSFVRHPSFRIFAAQNPLHQGGGRKGLPKSFLNRFTRVYVQEMSPNDLLLICRNLFPGYPPDLLEGMIAYMSVLNEETMVKRSFAREGAPWEFNLRDVIRWATLLCSCDPAAHPSVYLSSVILQRFRNAQDKERALALFSSIFPGENHMDNSPTFVSPSYFQVGHSHTARGTRQSSLRRGRILQGGTPALESLGMCVEHGWLAILTGSKSSGKTTMIRTMADILGKPLREIFVNSATDASDILGSFEETDIGYRVAEVVTDVRDLLDEISCSDFGATLHATTDFVAQLQIVTSANPTVALSVIVASLTEILDGLDGLPDHFLSRRSKARDLVQQLANQRPRAAQLEWVDGPLVRALKEGHWLLLDGANLCSPSVLDRLNSLCEIGGSLILNERGAVNGEVQVIQPHPDFRLFMCADGQYGELSRAMRNRGIEISLTSSLSKEDWNRVVDHLCCSPVFSKHMSDLKSTVYMHALQRHGLDQATETLAAPRTLSASRLVHQDSFNADVARLTPTFAIGSNPTLLRATMYFLANQIMPHSLPYLSRFLLHSHMTFPSINPHDVRAFLENLECSHIYRTIVQMRKNISQSLNIPPDALLAQPLYDMPSQGRVRDRPESLINASTILRLLRLYVSATSDYGELLDGEGTVHEDIQLSERARLQQQAATNSRLLARSIKDAAINILGDENAMYTKSDIVDKLLELVAFGRFLMGTTRLIDMFDFSLAIAVSDWVRHSLRDVGEDTPIFSSISQAVGVLQEVVSLKSGTGLVKLWDKLSNAVSEMDDQGYLVHLQNLEGRLQPSVDNKNLRAQVLDMLCVQQLAKTNDAGAATLASLTTKLQNHMQVIGLAESNRSHRVDFAYICAQLRVLSHLAVSVEATSSAIHDLLDYGCSDDTIALSTLGPYKRMLWNFDADESVLPWVARTQKQWLGQLWEVAEIGGVHGPAMLCHPVELVTSVLSCDDTPRSSDSLSSYQLSLSRRLNLLSTGIGIDSDRRSQLCKALVGATRMVFDCLEDENYLTATQGSSERDRRSTHAVRFLLDTLKSIDDTPLSVPYRTTLRPWLEQICDEGNGPSYVTLGKCWNALSRMVITLYVPNVPVDPAVIERCSQTFWSERSTLLQAELLLHTDFEQRTSGRKTSLPISYLSNLLETSTRIETGDRRGNLARSDVTRLHAYWTEVSQFLEQVVPAFKIDAIVAALEKQEAAAPMRAQVIQESTSTFCQRLDSVYPDYRDISMPIQLALLQLRMGLAFVAAEGAHTTIDSRQLAAITKALTCFPSVVGLKGLQVLEVQNQSNVSFPFALWKLSMAAQEVSSGVELSTCAPQLESIYEQSLGLWLIDKARREEIEKQSQTLYRHTTVVDSSATEAKQEERNFLALFPEYGDLLEDSSTTSTSSMSNDLVSEVNIHHLSLLHQSIFAKSPPSLRESAALEKLRRSLVHDVLTANTGQLPDTLDMQSRPYQISILVQRLALLHGTFDSSMAPNFYNDPHVSETRKSTEILTGLSTRLSSLIQEWPDQMVLQHLKGRVDAILQLDIFSPVAKILSAVEQLLLQMEDWEMYANKENTLKSYQHQLANLVVSWRRLELVSWQGLLRTQAEDFADGASDWWPRLYEATVRGVSAASQEEENGEVDAVTAYLDGLVPLLDTYMSSSPLGQFVVRLQHLLAFESFTLAIETRSAAFSRVHCILQSTRAYYAQFVPRVVSSLNTQEREVEKEIRNFIKLASWKDINVHALKQSAQKTHRQLYKCVRKFREILRQPVTAHLLPGTPGATEAAHEYHHTPLQLSTTPNSLPMYNDLPDIPDHLLHLDRTYKNLLVVIGNRINPLVQSLASNDVEDLSVEIITTSQNLASASAPPNSTREQRDKFQKSLIVRKRKAWSDMLKELKRIGLAVNIRPETLEQQSNPRWLREQPEVKTTADDLGPHVKSDTYFLQLTRLLPDLRALLGSHHTDIGTRDLQRGTNLVESAFSLAVEARACFADATSQYQQLRASVTRLHVFSESSRVVATGPRVLQHIVSVKEDLGRLVWALDEIITVWQGYLHELPSTEGLHAAIEELQSSQTSTRVLFNTLAEVCTTMRALSVPVLLESEATGVRDALEHVNTIVHVLRRMTDGPNVVAQFVKPLLEWITEQEAFAFTQFSHEPSDTATDATGQLIDRILLCIQDILSLPAPPTADSETSESPDRFIKDYHRLIYQTTRYLKVDQVLTLLNGAAKAAVQAPKEELEKQLARILPFLDAYLELARVQLTNHCAWTKSLFKLDYVLCSVMRTIAKDGFCKPPEAGEGEAGEAGAEDTGGMGLGEGAGSENVSKEIQEESQVEGLQGEQGEDDDVERAEEGNALEMSEDFGGKMQDVPDEEGDDDDEGEEEEEEGEEPEEQIGDLDAADPSAVDEKLWGDESGPEDSKRDEGQSSEDHSTEPQEKESEMVAKDEDKRKPSQKKEEAQNTAQEGEEGLGGESEVEDAQDEAMQEEEQDQQGGAPLDEFVPEAETLDLPDDMDFGKEDGKDPQIDEDFDMDLGQDEGEAEEEERPGENEGQDGEEDAMDVEGDNPQAMDEDLTQPDGGTEDIVDGATAQPDLHSGTGQDSGESGDHATAQTQQGEGSQGLEASELSNDPDEPRELEGNETQGAPQEESQGEHASDPHAKADESAQEGQGGTGQGRVQQGTARSQPKLQQLQSNPLRSLGDALREISQRIDEIMESEGLQNRPEQQLDTPGATQLEYIRPDEDQVADEMEALGPAQHEDVAKLKDIKFLDEDTSLSDAAPPVEESLESLPEPVSRPPHPSLHSEPTGQTLGEDTKSALTQTDVRAQLPNQLTDANQSLPVENPMPSDEMEQDTQQEVELALRQWQAEGQPGGGAEDVWRKYESLTHDLSYALCEQLRLILEPTMATRLKGDYRTGKRLNMKKIIPYIASEFTKDKIWLRRTRPSQREYQVLIALDDSRSMAESHSVHLAFQTLALVSKALGKLEVGDVAIAKFGETVEVLHGFDGGPFTDHAGTRVMSAFHFDQKATQVLSLVETSLKMLEQARERRSVSSSSAGDLWQLEIIISDGICQDHDRLRTVLRKAEEQRVMVVFIILDSLHSKSSAPGTGGAGKNESSILSMNQVAYKMVDGRMDLQVERYLDTFPFEYYVVLRNVEALPDVLSGTLKQFFERIAEA